MTAKKVTAEERAKQIMESGITAHDEMHTWETCRCKERLVETLILVAQEARRNADELFVLSVDCELGSGCPKNNTCSGASHWRTYQQIRNEASEEAAKENAELKVE